MWFKSSEEAEVPKNKQFVAHAIRIRVKILAISALHFSLEKNIKRNDDD